MRYFIGFLITIGLIVFILFLLLSGGSKPVKLINLTNYAYDGTAKVQLIIDGPVVADQNHQSLEIDVTQDQAALTVYKGYQRQIVRTQSYENNNNAFAVFMFGLQRAGFTNGISDKAQSDPRGYCVEGISDIYTFTENNNIIFRYWSTTCGQGTFKGQIDKVVALFKNQIPDYGNLTFDQGL